MRSPRAWRQCLWRECASWCGSVGECTMAGSSSTSCWCWVPRSSGLWGSWGGGRDRRGSGRAVELLGGSQGVHQGAGHNTGDNPRWGPVASSYSPECVEGGFSEVELPLYGVLRSSLHASNAQATAKIVTLGDVPPVARLVRCPRYLNRDAVSATL